MEATHVGQPVVGLEQLQVAGKTVCSPSLAPDPQPCRSGTQRCSALEIIIVISGLQACLAHLIDSQLDVYRSLSTPFLRRFLISPGTEIKVHSTLLLSQTTWLLWDAKVLTIGEGVHTGILHSLLAQFNPNYFLHLLKWEDRLSPTALVAWKRKTTQLGL